jgi:hypothetical protein
MQRLAPHAAASAVCSAPASCRVASLFSVKVTSPHTCAVTGLSSCRKHWMESHCEVRHTAFLACSELCWNHVLTHGQHTGQRSKSVGLASSIRTFGSLRVVLRCLKCRQACVSQRTATSHTQHHTKLEECSLVTIMHRRVSFCAASIQLCVMACHMHSPR